MNVLRIWRHAILQSLVFVLLSGFLFAQSPTDEWRRVGIDPMVAEADALQSLRINPAGLKSFKKNQDSYFDFGNAHALLSKDLFSLLSNPSAITTKFTDRLKAFEGVVNLFNGNPSSDAQATADAINQIAGSAFTQLVAGTSLAGSTPGSLTIAQITALTAADATQLQNNLTSPALRSSLANSLIQYISDGLGILKAQAYIRALGVGTAYNNHALAWGWSFDIDLKAILKNSPTGRMPLRIDVPTGLPGIGNLTLDANLPIVTQVYGAFPLRFGMAYDFTHIIPGMTFGASFKIVPYFGFNQDDLGAFLSSLLSAGGVPSASLIEDALSKYGLGMNIGLDAGLQYHFGALTPALGWLSTGFKISDLVGFNFYFDNADSFRYSIDFDWGIYMEQDFKQIIRLFGGMDIIQIRGLLGDPSPYSALDTPFDHFRFQAGVGFLNNTIGAVFEVYQSVIKPGVYLNLGTFQIDAAMILGEDVQIGAEIAMRFRGKRETVGQKQALYTWKEKRESRLNRNGASLTTEAETGADTTINGNANDQTGSAPAPADGTTPAN